MILFLLYECAAGYALFEIQEFDEKNTSLKQIQKSITKMETFSQMVRLKAFFPFTTAEISIRNAISIADCKVSEELTNFLESSLPKDKKKKKFKLATQDNKLGGNIATQFQIEIATDQSIFELFRGIRFHFIKFLKNKDFKEDDLFKASLGLAHSFSRSKHIIQSAAVIDLMDKNLNTFCMRVKEWFSWHFPELMKLVTDNEVYIKVVELIQVILTLFKLNKSRETLTEDHLTQIEEIVQDGELAQKILEAANTSMGNDISEVDAKSIHELCVKILKHFDYRKEIQNYLKERMKLVAPNLTTLLGENVGAKLISQAGSLVSLAKYPASTVQILGAEKALFRALKTRGNTPKYGLLFHSPFISRAETKDRGKISRYLANKCAIAARMDQFLIKPTTKFGERLKKQVEDRLTFLKKRRSNPN